MLGSSLCKFLFEKGEVFAFHRDKQSLVPGAHSVSTDLRDRNRTTARIEEIQPDLLVHCAGLVDIDQCQKSPDVAFEQNVLSTRNVVQACGEETKIVYISSDQVYGSIFSKNEGQKKLKPKNIYGTTKLAGEREVLLYNPKSLVIRTNVFGVSIKRNRTSFAEWVLHSLKNKEPIPLFTDYIFSPIVGSLLGQIILELVSKGQEGIFNVGSLNSCSKYEFGRALAVAGGFDEKVLIEASLDDNQAFALREKDISLDVEKLKGLGIAIPLYQESIQKFLNEIGREV